MIKKHETKTLKRFRIAQCVFFLMEILFCAFTFIHIPNPGNPANGSTDFYATVFDMIGFLFGASFPEGAASAAFQSALPVYLIFPIVPVIGFFFCALDKQRNLKNIVAIISCLVGVFTILTTVSLNFLSYGSLLALLVYIILSFITAVSMMARISVEPAN